MTEEDLKKMTLEQIEADKKKAVDDALAIQEEELKKLRDKEMNFKKARAGKEEILEDNEAKEKRIKELEESTASMKATVENVSSRYHKQLLKSFTGDDEELQKKVDEEYTSLKGEKSNLTDEEERIILEKAFTLATKIEETKGVIRQIESSTGGGNRIAPVKKNDDIDPEVKEWAGQFNKMVPGLDITDEDIKKYKK